MARHDWLEAEKVGGYFFSILFLSGSYYTHKHTLFVGDVAVETETKHGLVFTLLGIAWVDRPTD